MVCANSIGPSSVTVIITFSEHIRRWSRLAARLSRRMLATSRSTAVVTKDVAVGFGRIEGLQALQDAGEQLLLEVRTILLGEAGAADQLVDLAPDDAHG